MQSCSFQSGHIVNQTDPQIFLNEIKNNLNGYRVGHINIDYIARCKVQIKTMQENQSGSCEVIVTRKGEMKIHIKSPIGGTIFVIYIDKKNIQALDQTQQIFYRLPNNKRNRLKVFSIMNFSVKEFQSIIWGRETNGSTGKLKFIYQKGRPEVVKTIGNDRDIIITYKKWLVYEGVQFPKLLLIEDKIRHISIKMYITEFKPGSVSHLEINNVPASYQILTEM